VAIGIDQRIGLVPARLAREERDGLVDGHGSRQRVDLAHHHVADAHELERIDAVFPDHVLAPTRDLLCQDRTFQQQHRQRVGGTGGNQERADQREISGQLGRKQDRCQRRAHGAAHHRGHADQCPCAMVTG
jgi:hypothetical protein